MTEICIAPCIFTGPLTTTLTDFLRLLWEQKVPLIVMVTNLKEDGMVISNIMYI